jgi:GNAT superfamily N-acetyltransferase
MGPSNGKPWLARRGSPRSSGSDTINGPVEAIIRVMHEPTHVIEPPGPHDRDAVVALFAEDLRDLRLEVDLEGLGALYDRLRNPERAILLALRAAAGGPPLGVLVAHRNLSVKFGGESLWIEELYVARQARQRGYGRLLVEALLERARGLGISGIDLEAYRDNAPAAVLYRSLGFRRIGRERFAYRFAWEDDDADEDGP